LGLGKSKRVTKSSRVMAQAWPCGPDAPKCSISAPVPGCGASIRRHMTRHICVCAPCEGQTGSHQSRRGAASGAGRQIRAHRWKKAPTKG